MVASLFIVPPAKGSLLLSVAEILVKLLPSPVKEVAVTVPPTLTLCFVVPPPTLSAKLVVN